MSTLGNLLSQEHSSMLSENAKAITKEELEEAAGQHPSSNIAHHDMIALKKIAISRINDGQTPFTYTSHNFKSSSDSSPQDPSTCFCIL